MTAYLLVLHNPVRRRLAVGRLGRLEFPPGYYLYVGSGGRYPVRRVQRHLRPGKPVRWQIDRLTTGPHRMKPVDAYLLPGKTECALARRLARKAAVMPGFGSSDCKCPGHLFHTPGLTELAGVLSELSG